MSSRTTQIRTESLTNLTAGDAVTSLMYTSVVSVVLARILTPEWPSFWQGLAVVIFVFIDWLGRIGVPQTFPPTDQPRRRRPWVMTAKALLEIVAVYFLLIAVYHSLWNDADLLEGQRFFAYFLGASFLWNLIVLWVMTALDYWPLLFASVFGCVIDIERGTEYAQGVTESLSRAREKLQKDPTDPAVTKYLCAHMNMSAVRSLSQLVGHHISWVNLFLAIVIGFNLKYFFNLLGPYSLSAELHNPWYVRLTVLSLLLAVPFAFYWLATFGQRANQTPPSTRTRVCTSLGGISSVVMLILFYSTWDPESLIYVVVVQHALFGISLQLVIREPADPLENRRNSMKDNEQY